MSGLDPSAGPEGRHEGLVPTQVLISTRVQAPRGWFCFYDIFQHLNKALNRFIWQATMLTINLLPCQSREEPLGDSVCHVASVYHLLCRVATILSLEIWNMYLYDIYIPYPNVSCVKYFFVVSYDSLNTMRTLGDRSTPYYCFDHVHSDWLKPCINLEGDTRLSITPPVSGLH